MMLITNIIFVNNLIRWSFKGTWLISSISQEFSEQLPTQIITYHHWEWCNFSLKVTRLLPAHNIGSRKYCFRNMIFKDQVSFSNSTFKKSKYWKNTYLMLFWHNLGEEKTQHLKNLLFHWLYHIVYRLLVLYIIYIEVQRLLKKAADCCTALTWYVVRLFSCFELKKNSFSRRRRGRWRVVVVGRALLLRRTCHRRRAKYLPR